MYARGLLGALQGRDIYALHRRVDNSLRGLLRALLVDGHIGGANILFLDAAVCLCMAGDGDVMPVLRGK